MPCGEYSTGTDARAAGRSALAPSMTSAVRRCCRGSSIAAAGLSVGQKAKELAAGGVEGTLLGFGLAMRQQRPAVIADEVENDLLDWPSSEVAVDLQSADDLPTESPDVVAVLTQGLARQLPRQQFAQGRLAAFHDLQAGRNVACLIRPAAWPLIEIWAVGLQGIGGSLLRR